MDLKQRITDIARETEAEILSIRRYLHQHPELSFRETNTSDFIRERLDAWNIEYRHPFVNTGILALIRGKQGDGKTVALRSYMDALPIEEQTGLSFSSENPGVMHACGHDIHMACALGAAAILKKLENEIAGTVLIIFQPGEERIPGGAKLMLEEGIFSEEKPDVIIGQHIYPEMLTGKVGFKSGMYMASSDEIYITVHGQGGHGALPEYIHDPVLMASHILISLQQEVNRRAPKGTPTVLSFGKVEANGAVNIIPDKVQLEGTFRTMNEEWRTRAHQLIQQVAGGIASSMNGSVEVEIKKGYPVLVNDPDYTSKARQLAMNMIGSDRVEDLEYRMTAEDFAWFSQAYPAVFYRLGVRNPSEMEIQKLHTSKLIPDEKAVLNGMIMLSWLTTGFLQS